MLDTWENAKIVKEDKWQHVAKSESAHGSLDRSASEASKNF